MMEVDFFTAEAAALRRKFLPKDFTINDWIDIKVFIDTLIEEPIGSPAEFKTWLLKLSEFEAVISENTAWRYVNMTCDTTNVEYARAFQFFINEIQPKLTPKINLLNEKIVGSPFIDSLQDEPFSIMVRKIKNDIQLFREENIPIQTRISSLQQEYASIQAAMTITHKGKEMTLQQASDLLQSNDRSEREEVYRLIQERRLEDGQRLNDLLSDLIKLRHQMATNAGFENFRDYKFKALSRFDYLAKDCFTFHESVQKGVVKKLNFLIEKRRIKLGLEKMRPWDTAVDPFGVSPLKPFQNVDQLTKTTIECFRNLDPYFAECLEVMNELGRLDLESRKGKAPGGYNYPMPETGSPFIFMNATSTLRDMVTLLHEGGHAVHSFITKDLEMNSYKEVPSEVAELASMSMELLTIDHWHLFFKDEQELKRAKYQHLEQIIQTLPWVATIDKFQHWLYENPHHSATERMIAWNTIFHEFTDNIIDYSGLEAYKSIMWQKQLHIFEVPFYYIEYGIAQLGAIAVWKNFKSDPKKAISQYKEALALGYTKSIPDIYKTAGIKFDFSSGYIKELTDFVSEELEKIKL